MKIIKCRCYYYLHAVKPVDQKTAATELSFVTRSFPEERVHHTTGAMQGSAGIQEAGESEERWAGASVVIGWSELASGPWGIGLFQLSSTFTVS